jgi:Tol biopolymer transport system component
MAVTALTSGAAAQESLVPYVPLQPAAPWRTVTTPHFVFHFPVELERWTQDAAASAEAEREAIRRLIGYAPAERITVLVADPYNDANGSAYPYLHDPAVFLWPVPAGPRSQVGTARRWSELLTVHELAHIAHLTRPSRNPLRGTLAALLPTNLGPVSSRTPRWVWEGYATYVEGVLTRSGRPYGAWRPAYLREWAIEGKLPTYAQVSGTGGFAGGSFAYLAGSAYFEWLVAQRGDSSLPAVWRRLTARTPRSFDAAFAGVFPGTPGDLYARWTAEVTAEALATEQALRAAGIAQGTLVQRMRGATGDPAVSPDGQRVALVVRTPGRASRIVVWTTGAERPDTARARAVSAMLRRDPEDVAAVPYLPRPKRAIATLPSRDGRPFAAPRWMADGRRVLVERDEPRPDGTVRPDLWLWDTRSGAVSRVTHGAAVHDADPSPDGQSAIATRCTAGWCDVVRVELATGAATTLAAGSPSVSYARPRWDVRGLRFAVSAQEAGRWRVVLGDSPIDGATATLRAIEPEDGASRYDPVFLGDGSLLVTSERGGVPNVERLDPVTARITAVTRVTGAAMAPEPIRGTRALYFLALRSTGFDVRRISLDSIAPPSTLALSGTVDASGDGGGRARAPIRARVQPGSASADAAAAAVQARVSALPPPTYALTHVPPSRPYGLGPHRSTLLPGGAWTADGNSVLGVLASADPVGRATWVLQGAAGASSTWRGGSLASTLRTTPLPIEAQAFGVTQRAREDVRYWGTALAIAPHATLGASTIGGRVGGTVGRVRIDGIARSRTLAFATTRLTTTRGSGDRLASLSLDGSVARTSGDSAATRLLGRLGLAASTPLFTARGSYTRGHVNAGSASFEAFRVGGAEPALVDPMTLGQRLAMPALPTASLVGRSIEIARMGLGSGLLEPFAWAARAPDVSSRWQRVLGIETNFASGPIPFARAPGVRAVAGAAYLLDGPRRKHAQGYVSMVIRP